MIYGLHDCSNPAHIGKSVGAFLLGSVGIGGGEVRSRVERRVIICREPKRLVAAFRTVL